MVLTSAGFLTSKTTKQTEFLKRKKGSKRNQTCWDVNQTTSTPKTRLQYIDLQQQAQHVGGSLLLSLCSNLLQCFCKPYVAKLKHKMEIVYESAG